MTLPLVSLHFERWSMTDHLYNVSEFFFYSFVVYRMHDV